MVASVGGAGKSMLLLELHRRISFGTSSLTGPIFGGKVEREGTTVMLTSEDDKDEIHRRLAALDHKNERATSKGERLIVVPLPSAGGPVAFWKEERAGLVATGLPAGAGDLACRGTEERFRYHANFAAR